jgi:short subunit dehydrogenase-like uncharacterized protein
MLSGVWLAGIWPLLASTGVVTKLLDRRIVNNTRRGGHRATGSAPTARLTVAPHLPVAAKRRLDYGEPMPDWMIYGANGYTGQLVARLAVARGEQPILAGRDRAAVAALATELGLDHRVADLRDPVALRSILSGVRAVAHCAGPFRDTAVPMIEACLDLGTHYLDITGEIEVFDAVFARHVDAVAAGIALLPGAGFDVVPTDCLAASLHASMPDAISLELAFLAGGGISPGTARSALAGMAGGGRVRRGGALVPVPTGSPRRRVPFRSGERGVAAIRWGDLVTAYRSTRIPDITTYTVLPSGGRAARLAPMMAWAPVRVAAGRFVGAFVHGPDDAARRHSRTEVWGEVTDATGARHSAILTGPNAYDLTADSVVRAMGRIASVGPGAHTPSSAFGAGYAATLDGVMMMAPEARV